MKPPKDMTDKDRFRCKKCMAVGKHGHGVVIRNSMETQRALFDCKECGNNWSEFYGDPQVESFFQRVGKAIIELNKKIWGN